MGKTIKPSVPGYTSVSANNPYATAIASGDGVSYVLNPFLTQQNKLIEQTVPQVYQRLINPSLNDPISVARRNVFEKALNTQSKNAFENNLINPLSKRRMLRSSLLNDLSNNLSANQTEQVANFNDNLLANSLSDSQSMIDFLMTQYKNHASFGQDAVQNALNSANSVNNYNLKASSLSGSKMQFADIMKLAATIATYI